jgi:hypothetical protein
MFLQFLSEFACGNRWLLLRRASSASTRRTSMGAPGHNRSHSPTG